MANLKNTIINDTGYVTVAAGTDSQRIASPSEGMIRFNTVSKKMEVFNGVSWSQYKGDPVINPVRTSALDILNNDPTATSGVYTIQPDPNEAPFEAYCDMTTDGGGWTLVLSGGDTQFGNTSAFWDGTLNSNIDYTYSGNTFNTSNSEILMRSHSFTDMKVDYSETESSVLTSSANSTFATKKSLQTPWTAQSGVNLTWNQSDTDGYSRGNFLLANRGAAAGYGDYNWVFIGGTSWGYTYFGHGSYYETFSDTCGLPERCSNPAETKGMSLGVQGHRYARSTSFSSLWFR
jgi:hypothetical protein